MFTMAVRRISDLPKLKSNYPNSNLEDCLIEVSYSARENVYQSFYETLSEIKNDIILDIPKASKSQYGIVKIGNNINVDNGIISVPIATSTSAGILSAPPSSAAYLGTTSSGKFISVAAPTITTVEADDGDIINVAYPIGSLYITTNKDKPYPPQVQTFGPNQCTGPSYKNDDNIRKTMKWQRISDNYSLWTTNTIDNNIGQPISGLLPQLNSGLTISTEGDHQHAIAASTSSGTASVEGSGHHANKTVSTGSSTSLSDPTLTGNWSTNEQNGLEQYDALIDNGASIADIYKAAGIEPDAIINNRNYDYGAFSAGARGIMTYMDENSDNTLTSAIKKIVPTPGKNPANAYWQVVNQIATYLRRKHNIIPMARLKMEKTGAHSHNIVANPTGVYTGTNNTVRPTSLRVVIWQRVADV